MILQLSKNEIFIDLVFSWVFALMNESGKLAWTYSRGPGKYQLNETWQFEIIQWDPAKPSNGTPRHYVPR